MWSEIGERVTPLILAELDEDLREPTRTCLLPVELALQVQAVRELKRLREDVQHAARQAWLDGGEGRSA